MAWTGEQKQMVIIALFIIMIIVLVIELAYLKRRKRKKLEKHNESLSEKTFNKLHTTEKILGVMKRQGIDVSDAERALREARRLESTREYNMALAKCDEAKGLLQRAKAQHETTSPTEPEIAHAGPTPLKKEVDLLATSPVGGKPDHEPNEFDEFIPPEKSPDEPPAHYMQAKFIMNTVKMLLDEGKGNVEARRLYGEALAFFDEQNYSKALSTAIRAEKTMDDSGNVTLIAESKTDDEQAEDEDVHEVQATEEYMEELACHNCYAGVSLDDAFCRKCGVKLEFVVLCPGCENEVEPDDVFCRKCGEKLVE